MNTSILEKQSAQSGVWVGVTSSAYPIQEWNCQRSFWLSFECVFEDTQHSEVRRKKSVWSTSHSPSAASPTPDCRRAWLPSSLHGGKKWLKKGPELVFQQDLRERPRLCPKLWRHECVRQRPDAFAHSHVRQVSPQWRFSFSAGSDSVEMQMLRSCPDLMELFILSAPNLCNPPTPHPHWR